MTEEYTVAVLSIDQIDPETAWYQSAMFEVIREKPDCYIVYQVEFVCELKSGQNHKGYLFHTFSRNIVDDIVHFNLEEYFEDWIRVWVKDNGFPETVARSLES